MAAHFLADHALRDDAVLHVLFELFERDALRLGGLLQVFHGLGVHLLAQLVEPLDHLGVGVDAKLLALLQQQLLVDQVAQQVLLAVFLLGGGGVRFLLVHVGEQLLAGALQVGAGNDVVVDAGDDFFDYRGSSWARSKGTATVIMHKRTKKFFIKNLIGQSCATKPTRFHLKGGVCHYFTASGALVPEKRRRVEPSRTRATCGSVWHRTERKNKSRSIELRLFEMTWGKGRVRLEQLAAQYASQSRGCQNRTA